MEKGEIKQIGPTKEVMSQDGPIKNFSNRQLKIVSNKLQEGVDNVIKNFKEDDVYDEVSIKGEP